MLKHLRLMVLLVSCALLHGGGTLCAQQTGVTAGEYFWDSDPGPGNGTPIQPADLIYDEALESIARGSITLPAANGAHTFHLRVRDAYNDWGPLFSVLVYRRSNTSLVRDMRVVQAEYFWDTDPGPGNANAVLALDGNLDEAVESLLNGGLGMPAALGGHTFNLRVQDTDGQWSPLFSTMVHRTSNAASARSQNVTQAEYFWDTDPGQGNGNTILALDGNFDESLETILGNGLGMPAAPGGHRFNVRVRDTDGQWSQVFSTMVVRRVNTPAARDVQVVQAEYFWDIDPGQGNGNTLLALDGNLDQSIETLLGGNIVLPSQNGPHSFQVRVRDGDNQWSPVFRTLVHRDSITSSVRPVHVHQAEYYWNTDPGPGNGQALLAMDGNFDESLERLSGVIAISGLPPGPNALFIRIKGRDNVWGPVFGQVVVTSPPAFGADTLAGPKEFCGAPPATPVQYQADTVNGGTYTWSATGGTVLSGQGSDVVSIQWGSTEPYQVVLEGCNQSVCDTLFLDIGINALPQVNASQDTSICPGGTAQLAAISPDSPLDYLWSPAQGLSSTSSPNPGASPASTTEYFVTVTDSNACTGTDSVTVNVFTGPIADAGPDTLICVGDTAQLDGSGGLAFSWTPAAGLSNPSVANPLAFPTSSTDYTLTVTDANTCTATDEVSVIVSHGPNVNAGPDQLICIGASAQLNATGAIGYIWSPAASLSDPGIANPVATPALTTTYTVTGTDANTCSNTDQVTVTVAPLPVPVLSGDTAICIGESVQLSAAGGADYAWAPATGLSNPNLSNPVASPSSTTTYAVTVTSPSGCVAGDSLTVTVHPLPVVDAGPDELICAGDTAHLSATGAVSYLWAPSQFLDNPAIANPSAYPIFNIDLLVTGTDANGCVDTDSLHLEVEICDTNSIARFVQRAEYFWDTDPGPGNGTPLLATDGNFDETVEEVLRNGIQMPVTTGPHVFHVRVRDRDGSWGPVFRTLVERQALTGFSRDLAVTQAEYFWDTDPGPGNGSVMLALDGNLDETVESLLQSGISTPAAAGAHRFNVRVKDVDNHWGPVFSTVVSVRVNAQTARAVQVSMAEYFFDADPGPGNGVPMPVFDGNFDESVETLFNDTTSLNISGGVHTFSLRVKGADGVWGPKFTTVLHFDPIGLVLRPVRVSQAEYFWDTDPGQGNGTPVLALDGNLDESVESLINHGVNMPAAPGAHVFHVRVKDANNQWSQPFRTIVVQDSVTAAARSMQVTQAEYFWDTDPGFGNGTPMLAFDGNLDETVENLLNDPVGIPVAVGPHTFNVRVRDADQQWGPTFRTLVFRDSVTVGTRTVQVAQAEYFWDVDPGQGNGTAVLAFDGNFDEPVESLLNNAVNMPAAPGAHLFGLRVRDIDGQWGPLFRTIVVQDTIEADLRAMRVVQGEYFWNADPGPGNGQPVIALDGNFNNAVETVFNDINVTTLPPGPNLFNIRVRGEDGGWGPLFRAVVDIDSNLFVIPDTIYGPSEFCGAVPAHPVLYTADTNNLYTYTWLVTNGTLLSGQGNDSVTVQWAAAGPYFIGLEACDGSFCDTVFQPITIHPLPSANAGPDVSVCQGGSSQLFASGGVAYLWTPSAGLNDDDIPNPFASPAVTTTYTVTVHDNKGCSANDQVTVTVLPPAAANAGPDQSICAGDTAQLQGSGGVTYTWSPASTLSNPNIANPSAFPGVTTTYTLTVVNAQGCTGTDQVTVFLDNTPPSVTCPPNIVFGNDPGQCGASILYTTPVGTDNCPGAVTVQTAGLQPGAFFPVGTTLNRFRVTDNGGLRDSCAFTLTVQDTQPPVLNCPANASLSNDPGLCGAVYGYSPPVGTDNCPGATTALLSGLSSGSTFPVGTSTVTYRSTDASGNSTNCTFTVTVSDTSLPQINCPADITVGNDPGQCAAVVSFVVSRSDNCPGSGLSQTGGLASGSTFPVGTTLNTFTVTDAANNTASCSFQVVVQDTQAPNLACPANIILNNDPGDCSARVNYAIPLLTDNCGGGNLSLTSGLGNGAQFPVGLSTESYLGTDGAGNTATCTFTVEVIDAEDPQITCPANVYAISDTALCGAVVNFQPPVGTDNCPGAVTNLVTAYASGDTFPVGQNAVVFVVTDAAGRTDTCFFNVEVDDSIAPTLICPGPITAFAGGPFCNTLVNYTVTAYDNCPGDSLIRTGGLGSGVLFPVGVTTESYVLFDANGNVDSCEFTVTVIDTRTPTITCPPNIIANNNTGQCGTLITYAVQVGLDNCGPPIVIQTSGFPSGTFFPGGLTVNTFVVSDTSGNADSCSFTVTVNDVDAPLITCPANVTVFADTGSCSRVVNYLPPTATDNCPGVTTTLVSGPASGSAFPIGINQVVFQASDTSGNTSTCSFSVTVLDSTGPSITCPAAIMVANDPGQCSAVVNYPVPTGTDNCPGALTSQTSGFGPGQAFPIGNTTVSFTVTDASNNSASCSFVVTVNDTEAPQITCPASVSLNTSLGQCHATHSYMAPVGTDNCPNPVTVQTAGLSSGSNFPVGVTTQTFTVTDASGNPVSCSFTVTVTDNQSPALTCPAGISIANDPGQCGAVVSYTAPVGVDNCSNAVTNIVAGQISGSFFSIGTTVNTFQATDSSGNQNSCSFNVTVVDNEDPVITCPSVILRSSDAAACGTAVTYTTPFVTDNCPGATPILWGGLPSGSFFGVGTSTVTYRAVDASGNDAFCSFNVVVSDNVNPAIACPADTVLTSTGGGCGAVLNYPAPVGTDNCPGVNTVLLSGLASGATFPAGTTTVLFQALDNSGNNASCSFEVTVLDNSNPTISCPANIVRANDLNVCGSLLNYSTPQGTDNCSSANTQQISGLPSGATFPVGQTVNTFVVTDSSNNSDTCSFAVTVNDVQHPAITCPSDLFINVDSGACEAMVNFLPPVGTDNCPNPVTVQTSGPQSGSFFPIGLSTVGFQVTDASGNSAACDFEVTVIDNELPQINCPANITVNNAPGQCGAVVNYTAPVGTDNCPGAATVQTGGQASGSFVGLGGHTQTFVVTDAFGNTASCSFLVTVVDNEPPVIQCPANITVNANPGGCGRNVSFSPPLGLDNCPGASTVQLAGQGSGTFFTVGTTVQTFRVTDNAGFQAVCSFTIEVLDNEQPTITCPANIVRGNDAHVCGALVNYTPPVGTDNCSAGNTIQIAGPGSGSIFPVGTTTETYVVSDTSGNSDTCSFTITINDVQSPSIVCPNNIAINAAPGQCTAVATYLPPTGTDNCPGVSTAQVLGLGTGASFPIGTTIERFLVTDATGNRDSCQFTVVIIDNEQPAVTCPPSVSLGNTPNVCGAVYSYTPPVGVDNCPGAVTSQTNGLASGSTFPLGTTVQTFTVTDAYNNSASCSFQVTVADTQAPVIHCPANITTSSDPGGCGAVLSFVVPVGTDNCPAPVTIQTAGQGSGSLFTVGSTLQSYQVTDGSGNQGTCSFIIAVIDNTAPTISCPANIVRTNDLNVCGAIVTYSTPQGVDNCTAANTSQITGLSSGDLFPVGVTVNTFVVADSSGNSDTCSFTVTVNDTEKPRIICPTNLSFNTSSGGCEALVVYAPPIGTDNCPGVVTVQSAGLPDSALYPVGLTIQTFVSTDAAGNSDSCSFSVTVVDNVLPQIVCPSDTTVGNDPNLCGATVVYPTPVGTDNCPGALTIRTQGLSSGSFFPLGSTQQTFVVTDPYNNTATCSFVVTVADTQAPVINCQANPTVNSDPGGCGAVVSYLTPVGTDNCPGAVTTQTAGQGAGSFFPVGTTTETYLVTDASGNRDSCSLVVTVIDNTNPSISCPANIVVNNDPNVCGALVSYPAPVGTDNCSASTTTQIAGLGPGAVFPIGVTGETWQVTDSSGNSAVCSFSITVHDVQKPVITCPANITLPGDSGSCATIVNYSMALFDNCPGATSTLSQGLASGSSFSVGTTLVRYLASDIHGNLDSCSFTVTVNDGQPPVLTCPADTVLSNDPGICGAVVNYPNPTATDNCPGTVVGSHIFNLGPGATFPVGQRTEHYTATDASGNTVACDFTITVLDTEAPVINCQAGFSLPADLGNCGRAVAYNVPVGTDNCANPVTVLTSGIGSGGYFPVGLTVVTYTVTDASGNTDSCSIPVTILDEEEPAITCPPDTTIANDFNQCGAVFVYPPPVGEDNCSNAFTYQSAGLGSGALFPVGATAERFVTVDSSGNDDSCSFIVTVVDGQAPVISCPADITVLSDPGQCTALVNYLSPVGLDNCAGAVTVLSQGLGSGNAFPVGTTLERYIVTDSFANVDSCEFLVTVVDSSAPVLTCPADTLLLNDPGVCGAELNYQIPAGVDNCPGVVTVQIAGLASGSIFPVGNTVNAYVATDSYGNTDTCSFAVAVQDSQAPVIVCQASFTLPGDTGLCGRVVNYLVPVGTDNCSGALTALVAGLGNGNFFPAGTTEERYVVTDASGNTDSCSIFVTILDAEAPAVVCPPDTTVFNDPGLCGAVFHYPIPQGNDNCAGPVAITQTAGLSSGSIFPVGGTAQTFVAADSSGNTDSCTFLVTVLDTETPSVICPADTMLNTDPGQCSAVFHYSIQVSDNCPGVTSTQMTGLISGSAFPVGNNPVRYRATDVYGNRDSCEFVVTVLDSLPPLLVCPADTVLSNDPGICGAVLSYAVPVAVDNCPGTTTTPSIFNLGSGAVFPVGQRTESFTATDTYGNIASCSFTVTVADTQAPQIVCQAGFSIPADPGNCGALVTFNTPQGTDNCANPVTVLSSGIGSGGYFPLGTTVNVYTVTDASGHTASCSISVTVTDQEIPSITCPANISVANDSGQCGAAVTYPAVQASDNCGNVAVTQTGGLASGSTFPVGTTLNSFLVSDSSGNFANCSFSVTVSDQEVPVILCPASDTVQTAPGDSFAIVTYTAPTAADNCPGVTINLLSGLPSGGSFPIGTTTVSYLATDASGNTAVCSFTITVEGVSGLPSISCPSDTVVINDPGLCSALVHYVPPVGTDTEPGAVTTQISGLGTGASFPLGVTIETYVVTDTSGNTDTCSFSVRVIDAEAPSIACPADITTGNDPGQCQATVFFAAPVGGDNCPGAVTTQTAGLPGGSVFTPGQTLQSFLVVDASGNRDSCTFTVTVLDQEDPVITCPAPISSGTDPGTCDAVLSYPAPVAADNCGPVSVVLVSGSASGSAFPVGTTVQTFVATDTAGNSDSCSFAVSVSDLDPPTVHCPPSITLDNDSSLCGATLTFPAPVVADNCPGTTLLQTAGPAQGSFQPIGTYGISYTATDSAGNSGSCSFSITVVDSERPVLTCPNDTTVANNSGQCGAEELFALPIATDNCNTLPIVQIAGLPQGGFFLVGTTVQTFTVMDPAGNADTCSFNFIVADTGLPTIACPSSIYISVGQSQPGDTVHYTPPLGTDQCPGAITSLISGLGSGAFFPTGINQEVYAVTDANGNADTCSFNIVINGSPDTIPPTISCPANMLVNNDPFYCGAFVNFTPPQGTDNLPGATTALTGGLASGSFFPTGTTTQTYTVTDQAGNFSSCSFTITVIDVEPPYLTCPPDRTVNTNTGICGTRVYYSFGLFDNCQITGLNFSHPPGSLLPVGTTSATIMAADNSGNLSQCSFNITVVDNQPPVARCTNRSIVLNPNGFVVLNPLLINNLSTDNCGLSLAVSQDTFTCADIGTHSVTLYASDPAGNTDSCTAVVTVTDPVVPVADCRNITVQLDANGMASIVPADVDGGSFDNCGLSLSIDHGTFDCADVGQVHAPGLFISEYVEGTSRRRYLEIYNGTGQSVNLNHYQVHQFSNGSAFASNVFNLSGTLPDGEVLMLRNPSVTGPGIPAFGVMDYTGNDALGIYHTLTNSYTDIFGVMGENPGTAWTGAGGYQTIDRTLRRRPTVSSGVTVNPPFGNGAAGFQTLTSEWELRALNDTSGMRGHAIAANPSNVVTLYAVDGSGNVDSCSAVVTVQDLAPPQLQCPPDTVVSASNQIGVVVNYAVPVATDNCSATTNLQSGIGSGGLFPVGISQEVYEAADPSGNGVACVFSVEVTTGADSRILTPPSSAGAGDIGLNLQVYPNPFSRRVTFRVDLESPSAIELTITTLDGKVVAEIGTEVLEAGVQRLLWEGTDSRGQPLVSGLYIYRLRAVGKVEFGRVEYLRE